ncbi:hypothetical protein ACLESD_24560 [Pyxidicoccus sp. 3LFB2]
MAGNRKGRRLTLEGREYRWSLRGHRELADGHHYQRLTVVSATSTGQALHVLVRLASPWLYVQEWAHLEQKPGLILSGIGPGWVARVVELARAAGWDAGVPGPTLEFILVDNQRLIPLVAWNHSSGVS